MTKTIEQMARETLHRINQKHGSYGSATNFLDGSEDHTLAFRSAVECIKLGREQAAAIADEQAEFHDAEYSKLNDENRIQHRDFAKMRSDKCCAIAQAIRNLP